MIGCDGYGNTLDQERKNIAYPDFTDHRLRLGVGVECPEFLWPDYIERARVQDLPDWMVNPSDWVSAVARGFSFPAERKKHRKVVSLVHGFDLDGYFYVAFPLRTA